MEVTRDMYSFNLFAKLMVSHRKTLCSLAIAAIDESILMPTSAEQVPSLHTVSSSSWNLVTFSIF